MKTLFQLTLLLGLLGYAGWHAHSSPVISLDPSMDYSLSHRNLANGITTTQKADHLLAEIVDIKSPEYGNDSKEDH